MFGPGADLNAWRRAYWDNFIRVACFKTTDWEYEKEFRLILNPGNSNALDCCQRTLSYDFRSLKGIIFGIRMADNHKLCIFNVLTKKCRENHRTDFQFLQAYYSSETGDIRSYEIPVNLTLEADAEDTD